MNGHSTRTAIIIGASSGIGEALAHELNRAGWRLGLLARRVERLEALRGTLAPETIVRGLDVGHRDAAAILEGVIGELGGVDLAIISAGTGHNEALHWELDVETVTVESACVSRGGEYRVAADERIPRTRPSGERTTRALSALVAFILKLLPRPG